MRHSELILCFYCRLSWALMYAGFVFIASVFMSLVIKLFQMIILTGFMVLITLFTLYGLSLVSWQNMLFSSYKSQIYKPVTMFLQDIGSLELLILYSGFCMFVFMWWTSEYCYLWFSVEKIHPLELFFLPSDSTGFPSLRADKETHPDRHGWLSHHRVLGLSGLHCIVQSAPVITGVGFMSV